MQLVPTSRPKPEHRRTRAPGWPIIALRRLKTDRQFDREERRQDLLDRRWRRWRSIIFTLTVSVGALTGAIPLEEVVDALLQAIGIP